MESIKNRTLLVDNMVCEGCEEKIEKEISNLNGVLEVVANYKTGKVKVKYDILKISLKSIEYKLKNIGYNIKEKFLFKLKMGFIHFLEENEKIILLKSLLHAVQIQKKFSKKQAKNR